MLHKVFNVIPFIGEVVHPNLGQFFVLFLEEFFSFSLLF